MWSLYEQGKLLNPLRFSNGKTQEDIVQEALKAIEQGSKVIFIKGVCGTGKSAIALHLAKELGRASIIVPFKSLQKQYEEDYTHKKYLLKENGEKLKIKVITGRKNHKCLFESPRSLFSNSLFQFEKPSEEKTCDNPFLPCKIEIKEKNLDKLQYLLKQNNLSYNNLRIKDIKRLSIAPICPYWSPIYPSEFEIPKLADAKKESYIGLNDIPYSFYTRKPGCGYYEQFHSYLDADVLIFNSHKYLIEFTMNRKPETDVEIIDECDEFLDNFMDQKKININRLNFALSNIFPEKEKDQKLINELIEATKELVYSKEVSELLASQEILPIKETPVYNILKSFLDNDILDFVEDEENYVFHCHEVADTFYDLLEETYISYQKEDKDLIVNIVTTNLEKRFHELLDKNKLLIFMSGTLHSPQVLKNIFGIKDFRIIEAETKQPGEIIYRQLGSEMDCSFESFKQQDSREHFLRVFNKAVSVAEKPLLVHLTSFLDLPSEDEKERFNLSNLPNQKQILDEDPSKIDEFKSGKIPILFTTKCNRGVDFPGEICNSVLITRFPYPHINSLFWKVLKRTRPTAWRDFYIDKAKRELMQKIYRAVRYKGDKVYLLSPDSRVINYKFS
jgi:Rad3-related DNA helicase